MVNPPVLFIGWISVNNLKGDRKMANQLRNTRTYENLMRAFAGESQARNRYTYAAQLAKKDGYDAIAEIFIFTANQEKEHAEIFYKYLKEVNGDNIFIDGGYPVDIYEDTKPSLRAAEHNELEEYDTVYKNFGLIAQEEGFNDIAASFKMIAEIEKTHADRFGYLAELLEKDSLYAGDMEETYVCINCGHIHRGKSAPAICPVCKHKQGYFLPQNIAPFHKK